MKVKMDNQLTVTNIQRMCFHDGPGIRTTVFLKGCNLRCPWCSNPENINFELEEYEICGTKGIYGKKYISEQLVSEVIKDVNFWGRKGGITFSGGEPLMQIDALIEVCQKLKEKNIHIAIETALFIPTEYLQRILYYIDYFIVDVKILDKTKCKEVLGGELSVYKKNVELIYKSGKLKLFRIPCCNEYTFTESNRKIIVDFLEYYQNIPVQIFKIHELGESKYQSLRLKMWRSEGITDTTLEQYCSVLIQRGISVEIIQI